MDYNWNWSFPNRQITTPETAAIKATDGIKGFWNVTLTLKTYSLQPQFLTDVFGYTLQRQDGNRYRFVTDAVANAAIVDMVEVPGGTAGRSAAGTNHHVAFRVPDEAVQMAFRERSWVVDWILHQRSIVIIFYSLYFQEPGMLFEIATDSLVYSKMNHWTGNAPETAGAIWIYAQWDWKGIADIAIKEQD